MDLLAYAASCLLGLAILFGPAVITVALRTRRANRRLRTSLSVPAPRRETSHVQIRSPR